MNLLIDLDGTLTDPLHGIAKSIQYALIALGRAAPPEENLRWCIGPPLKTSLGKLLNSQDSHLIDDALAHYRERFSSVGLFENQVYPGIKKTLDQLTAAGHILRVATSKPTVFAQRIMDHFELSKYFHAINGSELDGTRSDKADLIAYILQREALEPTNVIMIGDREHDIIGARANHVKALGVLWGYGSKTELATAGAHACVAAPDQLLEIVNAMCAPTQTQL